MESPPTVSVIIAAAGAARTLPAALSSVAAQDYTGLLEVVVAAADDETARAAEGVTVVPNPRGSTPVGLNLAARASSGDILVRIDAQSVIPTDYVRRIVATLTSTDAGNVGGMQVPRGETFVEKAIAAAMSSRFGAGDAAYRVGGPPGPTDTVYLGAFRRSTFEKLGGYDETFLRHQDYELNHRIRSLPADVWLDPSLKVIYRPRSSLSALARQYFQYGRWKRVFARRHPGSLRPRQWAPPLLVFGLLASLLWSVFSPWGWVLPAGYLIALLVLGLAHLRTDGPPALAVPAALAVMHLSWGAGFLIGQSSER